MKHTQFYRNPNTLENGLFWIKINFSLDLIVVYIIDLNIEYLLFVKVSELVKTSWISCFMGFTWISV